MMTAADHYDVSFSYFTLALLEDSGWYKADYSKAENMMFGRGQGCAFIYESCIDPKTKRAKFPEFCDEADADVCSFERNYVAKCSLTRRDVPRAFDYFGNGIAG